MRTERLVAILVALLVGTAACDTHRLTTPVPSPVPAVAPLEASDLAALIPVDEAAARAAVESQLRETLAELRAINADPAFARRAIKLQPALAAELARMPTTLEEAARRLEAHGLLGDEHRALLAALKSEVLALTAVAK